MSSESSAVAVAPPRTAMMIGVGLVLLSAIGFSAKSVLIKLAYRYGVGPIPLLALRMLFSLPFFLAAAWWSQRDRTPALSARQHLAIITLGLLGYYMASLLDFLGLQYISAGTERLVLFLYPTLVVVISAIAFRHPIGRRETVALLLSYGGIGLAFLHDLHGAGGHEVLIGAALVFGSAVAYAFFLIGSGELLHRIGPLRFTAYAMTVSCAAVLIQFISTQPLQALRQPPQVYGLSLLMALLSTVMPAFLLTAGMRRIGARNAALIAAVGPVSTIMLAALFLGEHLSALQLAGTALVLGGVLTVSVGASRR